MCDKQCQQRFWQAHRAQHVRDGAQHIVAAHCRSTLSQAHRAQHIVAAWDELALAPPDFESSIMRAYEVTALLVPLQTSTDAVARFYGFFRELWRWWWCRPGPAWFETERDRECYERALLAWEEPGVQSAVLAGDVVKWVWAQATWHMRSGGNNGVSVEFLVDAIKTWPSRSDSDACNILVRLLMRKRIEVLSFLESEERLRGRHKQKGGIEVPDAVLIDVLEFLLASGCQLYKNHIRLAALLFNNREDARAETIALACIRLIPARAKAAELYAYKLLYNLYARWSVQDASADKAEQAWDLREKLSELFRGVNGHDMDVDGDCAVCLETKTDKRRPLWIYAICGHTCHFDCWEDGGAVTNLVCPYCRSDQAQPHNLQSRSTTSGLW